MRMIEGVGLEVRKPFFRWFRGCLGGVVGTGGVMY